MSGLFYNCSSLTSLPDISNWKTQNARYLDRLFYGCKKLKSLPDLSKLNTEKVIDMREMFLIVHH